jgi:hypothetical protein
MRRNFPRVAAEIGSYGNAFHDPLAGSLPSDSTLRRSTFDILAFLRFAFAW